MPIYEFIGDIKLIQGPTDLCYQGQYQQHRELDERVTAVHHFILIAKQCLEFNNYSSVMAVVVAGLGSAPIRRLHKTWEGVSKYHVDLFKEMDLLQGTTTSDTGIVLVPFPPQLCPTEARFPARRLLPLPPTCTSAPFTIPPIHSKVMTYLGH
eukprot:Em0009g4a